MPLGASFARAQSTILKTKKRISSAESEEGLWSFELDDCSPKDHNFILRKSFASLLLEHQNRWIQIAG
jgi:hypothetical protein